MAHYLHKEDYKIVIDWLKALPNGCEAKPSDLRNLGFSMERRSRILAQLTRWGLLKTIKAPSEHNGNRHECTLHIKTFPQDFDADIFLNSKGENCTKPGKTRFLVNIENDLLAKRDALVIRGDGTRSDIINKLLREI